jgi:S-(hydroxymethyl)glutathione dehydrogenase/alcohol dehydrogenase
VIGLGGVGLAAIMAAVEVGADPVVGVDIEPEKLEVARSPGATRVAHPDSLGELAASLPALGLDHVLECIGLRSTVELALRSVRPGGTATLVGMTEMGVHAEVDVYRFVEDGTRLLGSNYGSCVPARDFPAIAADVVAGRLPLELLVTEHIALDEVGTAFEAMRQRDGARRIVTFPSSPSAAGATAG